VSAVATRIFRFYITLAAGQANNGAQGNPSPFTITAPSGINRRIVEIRPWGTQSFEYQGNYDTELYHDIDSNDINTYHRPHYVALDINGTHQYSVVMTNNGSSSGTFGVDLVVEESALTTGGAAAPATGAA
jgi:hypothetical protein